jgi:hypothetical protein
VLKSTHRNPPVHVRYVGEAQIVLWKEGETYSGRVETLDGSAWDFSGLGLPDDLRGREDDATIDKIVETVVAVASNVKWNKDGTAGDIAKATGGGRRKRVSSAPPREWLEMSTDPMRNPRMSPPLYTLDDGPPFSMDEFVSDNADAPLDRDTMRSIRGLAVGEIFTIDSGAGGIFRVKRVNPAGLTPKGERMYGHVKASYAGSPRAKEIAARTVYARAKEGAKGLRKNPLYSPNGRR